MRIQGLTHIVVIGGIDVSQVLQTYTSYPTNVEVCVITNAPERLFNVMHSRWNFTSASVCGTRREMTHAFQLAWEHRDIMELAYERGEYLQFVAFTLS